MVTMPEENVLTNRPVLSRAIAFLNTQLRDKSIYLSVLKKGYLLAFIGMVEQFLPFSRMLILSHMLTLRELGFVSVLVASIYFIELSSDIAIFRFVFATPKDEFKEALAAAHALSVSRGVLLTLIALFVTLIVANALSLGDDAGSFMLLAPVILIRSFENLAPKVAERDFHYWPQFKVVTISGVLGLITTFIVAYTTHNHYAVIASFYVQVISSNIASRIYADVPYQISFRQPMFSRAFNFGYPLVVNGFGLAISLQADRFIVAGLFSLQTVALYTVAVLAMTVPISLIMRVYGSILNARFYNAEKYPGGLAAEIRFGSILASVISTLYAGSVIFCGDFAVGIVFGERFRVGYISMCLLGMSGFIRITSNTTFTALMLNTGRTKKLALSNITISSGLIYMAIAAFISRTFQSILSARLAGDLTSFVVTLFIARSVPDGGNLVFSTATYVGFALVCAACAVSAFLASIGAGFVGSLAAFPVFVAVVGLWGWTEIQLHRRELHAIAADASQERALPESAFENTSGEL